MYSGAEAGTKESLRIADQAQKRMAIFCQFRREDQHLGWREHAAPGRPREERVLETSLQEGPVWPRE